MGNGPLYIMAMGRDSDTSQVRIGGMGEWWVRVGRGGRGRGDAARVGSGRLTSFYFLLFFFF